MCHVSTLDHIVLNSWSCAAETWSAIDYGFDSDHFLWSVYLGFSFLIYFRVLFEEGGWELECGWFSSWPKLVSFFLNFCW